MQEPRRKNPAIIEATHVIVRALALSALGLLLPSTTFAQHGPARHGPSSVGEPAYDLANEATFKGTVTDVKSGRSLWGRLFRVHTLGLGHKRVQERQLLLKTGTDVVRIHLGPTAFLNEKKVEIKRGDTLEVTGSGVTVGKEHVVLAREIRKGDTSWALRDATGQPLWNSAAPEAREFWTSKKVLLTVVAVKVALLATVLRH